MVWKDISASSQCPTWGLKAVGFPHVCVCVKILSCLLPHKLLCYTHGIFGAIPGTETFWLILCVSLRVSRDFSSHRHGLALKLLFVYQTARVTRLREGGRLANRQMLGICNPFIAYPGVMCRGCGLPYQDRNSIQSCIERNT